jgi:hypothetical protein
MKYYKYFWGMHQLYIMAILTTIITILIVGGLIRWKTPQEERPLLLTLMLLELPMAFAAYYLVRIPLLDGLVQLILNKDSGIYRFVTVLYAPLTEEPAKLLPMLIPFFRRKVTDSNCLRAALALGLGFGIGEIWLVANFIASVPAYANIPWYQYTGFLNERFMVCVIHGVFTATALRKLHNGFIWGLLGAMFLHLMGNFPIYLSRINFGNLGHETWQIILTIYVPLYFILMLLLLSYYNYGKANLGMLLFGKSHCPECGYEYAPPILALNWITKRYERCPNCKKWHWVNEWKKEIN